MKHKGNYSLEVRERAIRMVRELGFGLFNLADRRYWQSSNVIGRPPDDRLLPLLAEPGRSARLRVTWSY